MSLRETLWPSFGFFLFVVAFSMGAVRESVDFSPALIVFILLVGSGVILNRLHGKAKWRLVALALLIYVVFLVRILPVTGQSRGEPNASEKPIQRFVIGGRNVGLFKGGDAYYLNGDGSNEFIQNIYIDPHYYKKHYVEEDGKILRILRTGETFEPYRKFHDGFEKCEHLRDLIVRDSATFARCWDSFTLQSPSAPKVSDYISLKRCILNGSCDFKDNRIDVSSERVKSGKRSLKCFAVKPSAGMVTSKASLRSGLFDFRKGDDLWFEAWYFLEKGGSKFITLVDFESSWIVSYAGPRIVLSRGEYLGMELKFADKPLYTQTVVKFPRGQWVRLKSHLKLSEKDDGIIEVWQNDIKALDTTGRTLPTADTILTNVELGISATRDETVLYVDDVRVSVQRIPSSAGP